MVHGSRHTYHCRWSYLSALSQGKNAQKLEGGHWGQALQPHVLRCCTCSRASPWIACGRGSAAPVQNCAWESAAQDCALLAQPPHCTWVIVHRYNWDVVGWVVWVRFQSGASVKGTCVSQPPPTGKNIWEGTLGPNAVFCCSAQYSDIQSQAKQFCDPASLALKWEWKPNPTAKDISSSYRVLLWLCVLNSY